MSRGIHRFLIDISLTLRPWRAANFGCMGWQEAHGSLNLAGWELEGNVMFREMKNISISVRLVLALLPIIAGLGYLSYSRYEDQSQILTQSNTFITLNRLVGGVGNLIYGLQKERGMSALFLGSKGASYRPELQEQRKKVDQALAEFEEILVRTSGLSDTTFTSHANILKREVQERLAGRSAIDSMTIAVPEEIAGYTKTVGLLIDYIAALSKVSDRADINNNITANVAMIECIERAGQERATGSAGFSSGSFGGGLNRRIISLIAEQSAYLGVFRRVASSEQAAALAAVLANSADSKVQTLRHTVIDTVDHPNGESGGVSKITAGEWFKATTDRIDALRTVSDKIQGDLRNVVEIIHEDAQVALRSVLIWITVGAAFAAIMMSIVVFGITRPILRLTKSMNKLASGDVNIDIPEVTFNDEVGQMAEAMRVFRDGVAERNRLLKEESILQEKEEFLTKQLHEDAMGAS